MTWHLYDALLLAGFLWLIREWVKHKGNVRRERFRLYKGGWFDE